MSSLVAKRYTKALVQSGIDIEATSELLGELSKAITSQNLISYLQSPVIEQEQKVEMVLASINGADEKIVNLIKLLGQKRRLDMIPAIAKELASHVQDSKGEYTGTIESSDEVDAQTVKNFEEALSSYTGKSIKLETMKSQKSGELKVRVDELGVEASFSKALIKDKLIEHIAKSI